MLIITQKMGTWEFIILLSPSLYNYVSFHYKKKKILNRSQRIKPNHSIFIKLNLLHLRPNIINMNQNKIKSSKRFTNTNKTKKKRCKAYATSLTTNETKILLNYSMTPDPTLENVLNMRGRKKLCNGNMDTHYTIFPICTFEIFHNKKIGRRLPISFKRITKEHSYLIPHIHTNSLEKTLMLGRTEGRRRRG